VPLVARGPHPASPGLCRDGFRTASERRPGTVSDRRSEQPCEDGSRGEDHVYYPARRPLSQFGVLARGWRAAGAAARPARLRRRVEGPGSGNAPSLLRHRPAWVRRLRLPNAQPDLRLHEDVQAALAALDVHYFTLVGHSLGGAVASGLAERLGDDVAALVLMAPAGFGRIRLAEAIQLPGVRSLVRHGLPLALQNPVTAFGVYMAVIGNGHRPDPELVTRLRENAYRWALGAECANEAIKASGLSDRAFHRRQLDYHGPVLALWGDRDRLVPLAHRDGVMTAFPQAQVRVWKKMGHHPQRERPSQLARFIEAACSLAPASAHGATSAPKPLRKRGLAARFTPGPLMAGVDEMPGVAAGGS
jgi:pimeloyl-ACP methyl ester carboxylesterase